MLTFQELNELPAYGRHMINATNVSIINDMSRRIAKLGRVSDATDYQALKLEELGASRATTQALLRQFLNVSEPQLESLFNDYADKTLSRSNNMLKRANYKPIPLADNPSLRQILNAGMKKTHDTFRNITKTTANTATKQFEDALDLAHMQIMSGAFDYQTAIKQAVSGLAKRGVDAVRYPSGKVDSLDVATRRALLTGVNQTCAEIQLENMYMLGADLVETTAHPSARPSHMVWQGKVFQYRQGDNNHGIYPDFVESTGYGTGEGICGWNCRHSFFPYFEGDDHAYSNEKLREYNNAKVNFNGKEIDLYDASQMQHYLENQVRQWKNRASALDAAGLDNLAEQQKIRQWQARLRDFTNQTGLEREYMRERGGNQLTKPRNPFLKYKSDDMSGVNLSKNSQYNGLESDIITKSNIFTSEKTREALRNQKPVDKELFERVKNALEKQGITLTQSEEADRYLERTGKEAFVIYPSGDIVMHTNISNSGLYEELIHLGQVRTGKCIEGDISNIITLEIEAQEKLIKYKTVYNITDYEIELIKTNLSNYKKQLIEIEGESDV